MEEYNDQYKIAQLIFLELRGELSDAEEEILNAWKEDHPELYNKIIDETNITNKLSAYRQVNAKDAWDSIDQKLVEKGSARIIHLRRLLKYAVAASILLLVGSYLLFRKLPIHIENKPTIVAEIPSGTQKATLTTSKNEVIELGEEDKSQTFQLTNVSATDTNNTLTFNHNNEIIDGEPVEIAINTLTTPRGGEYSIILSDGTKVFINAESKLIFPEIFSKDKREVILEGEAYFEVTASNTSPFIVNTADYNIKVYGTAFNVSAYSSDIKSHTTLVEGSVGINTSTGKEVMIIPGEQAYYTKSTNTIQTKHVDTYVYTSWKDGVFVFDHESLGEIMQKLERWYDIKTEYVNDDLKHRHFSGSLSRYEDIADILKLIALSSQIEFAFEGNVVTVKKKVRMDPESLRSQD